MTWAYKQCIYIYHIYHEISLNKTILVVSPYVDSIRQDPPINSHGGCPMSNMGLGIPKTQVPSTPS